MATRLAPSERLLVSFNEAAALLDVSQSQLRNLIAAQLITPHPVLANKIARAHLEDFAQNYGTPRNADPDTQNGRTLDARPAEESWGVPSLRL